MKHWFLLNLLFFYIPLVAAKPFCATHAPNSNLIVAYLGADAGWNLANDDETKLAEQLAKVSVVNYSFIRQGKDINGNAILSPSKQDIENIQLLRTLRPDLPVLIAVGGWGERDGFQNFVTDKNKRNIFIQSVHELLKRYQLDGIDVDWENELLAGTQEIAGVAALLQELRDTIGNEGYCITNAVPATRAYWKNYPDAQLWEDVVNWTTVMAYDHYGTFGPRTEHAAALYEFERIDEETYPYPNTSGHEAVQHYYEQGLPADKIILGLPFYCHSYYVNNDRIVQSKNPGLYVQVIDSNINSQVSYIDAYTAYADQLHGNISTLGNDEFQATTFYVIIPVAHTNISRFMSCEGPESIIDKMAYVKGHNPLSKRAQKTVRLGGVSFWSLQQDLPFSHPSSLLRAIHDGASDKKL